MKYFIFFAYLFSSIIFSNLVNNLPDGQHKNESTLAILQTMKTNKFLTGKVKLFNISKQKISAKINLNKISGWNNRLGVYSSFSNSYYFFDGKSHQLIKVKASGKQQPMYFNLKPFPGNMVKQCTKEGYLIIYHSLKKQQGFSITLFDTKTDQISKEDIFFNSNQPFTLSSYNPNNNICIFSANTELKEPSHSLYKFNLSSFEFEQIYTTKAYFLFSRILCHKNVTVGSVNKVWLRSDSTGKWIKNQNEPTVIWLDNTTNKVINKVKINRGKRLNIGHLFYYKNKLHALVNAADNQKNKGDIKSWVYVFNPKKNKFKKIRNKAFYNFYWNEIIQQNNKLVLINYQGLNLKMRIINLDEYKIDFEY